MEVGRPVRGACRTPGVRWEQLGPGHVSGDRRVGFDMQFRDIASGLDWGEGEAEVKKRDIHSWILVIIMICLIAVFPQK